MGKPETRYQVYSDCGYFAEFVFVNPDFNRLRVHVVSDGEREGGGLRVACELDGRRRLLPAIFHRPRERRKG